MVVAMSARRAGVFILRLLSTVLCVSWCAAAPGPYTESEVKAAFLYRFAGYVEWPATAMDAPRFVIAVLGADAVAASLERALMTIRIKDRPGEVRRIDDIRDARQAHIVYIGARHTDALDSLLPLLANRPVLVVTDGERGLDAGGMLNFRMVDQRVRFEVALDTAEAAGLSIGAELLAVAMQVRRADLRSDDVCPPPLHVFWPACDAARLAARSRLRGQPCALSRHGCVSPPQIQSRSHRPWLPPA